MSNISSISARDPKETKRAFLVRETSMSSPATLTGDQDYDRLKEVKQFDDSKIGVKGLLDSGLTSIPRFFCHPPEARPSPRPTTRPDPKILVPVVDLSAPRSDAVDQIRRAAVSVGFFQVTNHGVPAAVIRRTVAAVKAFNEQPTEEKMVHYRREIDRGITFSTNVDLFHSKAASWRDTIQMRAAPNPPIPGDVPEAVRSELFEWDKEVSRVGSDVLGLLSEGLGVRPERLKEMGCSGSRTLAVHYYPYCPDPDLTYGLTSHTDPGVVTVVLQNGVGGLQVKYGEEWVDVEPVPDALVINIGDILQIMSNDEYKSVEHRVLANPLHEARVSVAIFFNTSDRESLFGPLPELVSPDKPARYRQFTMSDYMQRFFKKELDGKTLTNYYRV
ncbi:1-aminocyclopropane-1-carboxylate oxidase homolog 6-like [Actinidia eriantha]|uniref:1-aminocyclopropane-1-carboxylate oxidase homolog 6-like n=1 Tax=Actinidia eriantha TaxID=165200 RepID=UPI00258FF766|nr:1-aminocyclopropane-1-carboxylate oxidase homolog 6-like [Actinidia eriantha]